MALVRYRVPYAITTHGRDTKSGKPVTNIFYYRCNVDTPAALGYGEPIAGSSTTTMLTNFLARFTAGGGGAGATTVDILSVNYALAQISCRAIIGRRYTETVFALTAVSPGLGDSVLVTPVANGFAVGQSVSIQGTTAPSGLNGTHVITQIDSPQQFRIAFSFVGSWTGDGNVQLAAGDQELYYDDNDLVTDTITGDISGEALPLTNSASVRRINSGTGRNWISRVSMAPIAESSQLNGKFTTAYNTLADTWIAQMKLVVLNAATTNERNKMFLVVVSQMIALSKPTPFGESDSWCRDTTNLVLQPNLGTMNSRKPRLTASIA